MPKNPSAKKHSCPGKRAGGANSPNCRNPVKTPSGKPYCPVHQTYCSLHGGIDLVHLNTEPCTNCEGEKEKARKLQAAKDKKEKEEKDKAAKKKAMEQSARDKAPLSKKNIKK